MGKSISMMTQFEVASNRRLRRISGHVRNEGPSAAATAADDANDGVVVAGAGLVGCFMAYVLARRGFNVTLVEKWPDMRSNVIPGGRSINLVLTHRGLCGLDAEGLHDAVRALCVPAKGRMMHSVAGDLTYQAYSKHGEFNNSISREELNKLLLTKAEAAGVTLRFGLSLDSLEMTATGVKATFSPTNGPDGAPKTAILASQLIGADGGGSAVRYALRESKQVTFSEELLSHGYKEMPFPAALNADGKQEYTMDKDSLHIWPRD